MPTAPISPNTPTIPRELEAHLRDATPEWAAAITGLPVEEIEAFARLVGTTKKSFFRLGYGFTRQRNGAVNMHAALSMPTVTGAWQYEGGGAFHSNSGIFREQALIEGLDVARSQHPQLDQSQIGRVLTGDAEDCAGRPAGQGDADPEHQPDERSRPSRAGEAGLCLRDDLFTVRARAVHDRDGHDGRYRAAGDHVHGA
jgi:hypothetical protein